MRRKLSGGGDESELSRINNKWPLLDHVYWRVRYEHTTCRPWVDIKRDARKTQRLYKQFNTTAI